MTQHTEPKALTTRQGKRAFASPGMIRTLAGAVMAVGVVAGISGVAYDLNGATQARAAVVVGVHARPGAVLQVDGTTPIGAPGTVLVKDGAEPTAPFGLTIPGIPADTRTSPGASWLEGHEDTLTLHSWGSTVPEQLLNRGGFAVVGLCMGVGAVWLRRVLISIAEGRPFQSGNAARIAGILPFLLALAEAFRRGAELAKEVEGLV